MSGNIDILRRLPEIASIGREKLQAYCDEWLTRPIAREYGISALIVGSDLLLTANLNTQVIEVVNNRAFTPIFELPDYIVDRHFQDADKRRQLHTQVRDLRQRWDVIGYQYEAMTGRVGKLWIKCKNPACDVSMGSSQQAVEGQVIHCPPTQATCPECGHTDWYDGSDLHLRLDLQ
jgi:hypothetical protein